MFNVKTFVLNFSQNNPKDIITGLYYSKDKDACAVSIQPKTWDGSMRHTGFGLPRTYRPDGKWFSDKNIDGLEIMDKGEEVDFLPYISEEDRAKVEKYRKEFDERGGSWEGIWPELND